MKYYRTLRSWTQSRLAEAAELSSNYIAEIESGKKYPSLKTVEKVCEALDIDAYKMLIDRSRPEFSFSESIKQELISELTVGVNKTIKDTVENILA